MAPAASASSDVRSVDPLSTTISSFIMGGNDLMTLDMDSSSLKTGITRAMDLNLELFS